jgi:hypothetical protein
LIIELRLEQGAAQPEDAWCAARGAFELVGQEHDEQGDADADDGECNNRSERSRPYLACTNLLICVNDLQRPSCTSMVRRSSLWKMTRRRRKGQHRAPTKV